MYVPVKKGLDVAQHIEAKKVKERDQDGGDEVTAAHSDPKRGDGEGLDAVFQEIVFSRSLPEMIQAGIILARATKSTLLYTQMIGRGTRLHPGKDNITVVDIVDATRDHSLTTLPGLFGLSGEFDLEGHTTDEAHVRKRESDSVGLVTRDTLWRRSPASEKQIDVLRRKKVSVPEGLTKGQASHLIGMLS